MKSPSALILAALCLTSLSSAWAPAHFRLRTPLSSDRGRRILPVQSAAADDVRELELEARELKCQVRGSVSPPTPSSTYPHAKFEQRPRDYFMRVRNLLGGYARQSERTCSVPHGSRINPHVQTAFDPSPHRP